MDLAPGTRVGRYVVEARIGRGGMASVFRVRHPDLGTRFALKLLDLRATDLRDRLLAEGRMQASLQHPNIVSVVDVVVHDGCPGLLMEYVDGPSLKALIAGGPVPATVRDEIVTGILHGVRAAHRLGFVHRDLKPANILLARTDDHIVPKVADFGLAKAATEAGDARRTRSGMMFGTPTYMAPEQARSARDVDQRADVFALGVVFYELCTGRVPVESEDLFDLFAGLTGRLYPTPRELAPELPEHQERAILGALEPDRDLRIPDCDALLAAWRGEPQRQSGPEATPDRSFLHHMARLGVGDGAAATPMAASRSDESTRAPARRPESGGVARAAVVVGGVGVLGAVAASVGGLVVLAIVGGVWIFGSAPLAPTAEVEVPEPIVAVPGAAPAPIAPTEPPPVIVAPKPPPRPVAVVPAPRPVERSAPTGEVRVTGDPTRAVTLRGEAGTFAPGRVPAGVYTVEVKFADGSSGGADAVTVPPDTTVVLECRKKEFLWKCKTR